MKLPCVGDTRAPPIARPFKPIGAVRTMDEQLSNSLARRRFSVTLLTAFGVVAVSLAAIGLYGVLAFVVAQRRREIGLRMALGARARDVITDVLGQGMRLALIGVAVGIGLALAATRLLRSLLFGTSPTDAVTYVAVATLLVVVAAGASFIPALRASRVDPLIGAARRVTALVTTMERRARRARRAPSRCSVAHRPAKPADMPRPKNARNASPSDKQMACVPGVLGSGRRRNAAACDARPLSLCASVVDFRERVHSVTAFCGFRGFCVVSSWA